MQGEAGGVDGGAWENGTRRGSAGIYRWQPDSYFRIRKERLQGATVTPDRRGIRTFGGVIDEFMLCSRVPGPNEIGVLHDEGAPD